MLIMLNFRKIVGNLYIACLFFQIYHLYDINNSYKHNSLVLKSIDDVISNIYLMKNQIVKQDVNQIVKQDVNHVVNCILDNISNTCETQDYINWSNILYGFSEYIGIFCMSVVILEFYIIQNKIQGIFTCLSFVCIHYGVIWKHLLNLWHIDHYHEHIWLGVATVGFTTFSNSLVNTKIKRDKLHEIFKLINIPYSHYISIYNYVYILGLISLVILCLLSNQYILFITLSLYVVNLLLCPQYFIAMFEIISTIYLNIYYLEYYNLLSLCICYTILSICDTFNYVIKNNIIMVICVKTIGIFFNNIYVKYLC